MSSISWLDFSDAERRRALQIVELLTQPETRDELGLGAIRDAFAEALFPGTSTVQRRARYFLLVPWTFREIERRHWGSLGALDRARREELRLIESLLEGGETDGVIGGRARKNLRQVPSMIYWQGLARWGIRRMSGTREQWARAVARSNGPALDDDGQAVIAGAYWWHSGLPEPPESWPDERSLELHPTEARYLRERIRDRCAGTMLATLVERRDAWPEVGFAWQLDVPELPAEQRQILDYGRRFSETMHGASLLYNHALAVANDDQTRIDEYRASLELWATEQSLSNQRGVAVDRLWEILAEAGSRHSASTRAFVQDWFRVASDPARTLDDPAVRELVATRERLVKGRLARLSYDAARETWRGAAGAGQLDFRWGSTQRQVLDIVGAVAD